MALATNADVEKALGREMTAEELARVEGLIDDASDLVLGYLDCGELQPIYPGAVVRATASMVAAVFERPKTVPLNAEQASSGIYGIRYAAGSTGTGPWLTSAIKQRLDPFRCGNVSVGMVSERYIPEATTP